MAEREIIMTNNNMNNNNSANIRTYKGKAIKCVETGQIFNNSCEAARCIGVNRSRIYQVLQDQTSTVKNLHFCYVDEAHNNNCSTTVKKANTTNTRAIYCVETGRVFNSIAEAMRELGLRPGSFSRALKKPYHAVKGMHFRYVGETVNDVEPTVRTNELTIQEKATVESTGKHFHGCCKEVLCITDGKIFNSALDAAEHYGIVPNQMSVVCRSANRTAKGMRFCYLKDINLHLNEITTAINKANAYDILVEKENVRKEHIANVNQWEENVQAIEFKICEYKKQYEEKLNELQRQFEEANIALANAKQALADFN